VSPRSRQQPRPTRPQPRSAGPSAPEPAFARWTEGVRPVHAALALGVIHLVLVLLSTLPVPHTGGDNAAYLALAQSLREHGAYRELWDPAMRPHTQYPPGFPLILAGAMTLGIGPWMGFKVVVALFSGLAVAFSYLWARSVSTAGTALGVGVLLALSPGVVDLGRWELSDVPFWAFTMFALWAFARLEAGGTGEGSPSRAGDEAGRGAGGKASWVPLAVASLATLLAYATRSAGVPLVVAGAAWLVWRRRWTPLAVFAAAIAPFAIGWWLRNRAVGGPGYTGYLWYVDPYRPALGTVGIGGMFARMVENVEKYTSQMLPYLLTGIRSEALVLGIAVVVLALAGWVMRVRRRPGVAELWLPLYMGLVLVWPAEWAGDRFLLPALPMLLVCAAEPFLARVPAAWRNVAGMTAVGSVVALGVVPLQRQISNASECRAVFSPEMEFACLPETWEDLLRMAQSVRGTLPDSSVVLSRKATLFWAYSGYTSRTYPFTDNPDTLLAVARDANARYVLLDYMDDLSVIYLAPVLMQRPQAFCVIRAAGPGRATLMAILPGAEAMNNVRNRPGNEQVDVRFPRCPADYWAPGHAPPEPGPAEP